MSISSIVSRIVPAAIGFATGGPVGATVAAMGTETAKRQERTIERENAQIQQEYAKMMDFGMSNSRSTFVDPYASQLVVNAGGNPPPQGFFSTVRGGLKEIGGVVSDVFSSGLPQLFGFSRPAGVAQQPAMTTITNVGAAETQGSGSIQAGAGSLLPTVLGGARSLLKSPLGQVALGGSIGTAIQMLGPDGKPMRVTRRMRAELKSLLRMTGNNYALVGDFLGYNQDQMLFILSKRFRNDGPVVTKAALRKTKQTVRRLKSMCDMYDSLRPAARRRTTPMRRASTTLIKN